jgi:hypothetical protein
MSNKSNYKYGAVGGGDDEETRNNFKESDLLYYEERKLTQKEKTMKIIKIAVPVMIAVLVIGGFAWFLLRDFGHLYPGPSAPVLSPSHSTVVSRPSFPEPPTPSATTKGKAPTEPAVVSPTATAKQTDHKPSGSSSSDSSSSGGSDCSLHPKCNSLGLTGECCPTISGDSLDCCS